MSIAVQPPPSTAAAASVAAPPVPTSAVRSRVAIVIAAVVVGGIASAGLGIWHPEPDANDEFGYALIAPIRSAWWVWHVVGGLGTALLGAALGLAVCLLVPRRGARWATAGAAMVTLGTLSAAVGIAAEGMVGFYATDPDGLPTETGTAFVDHVNDNFEHIGLLLFPGFLLAAVGALLLAVALWRARTVPRWLAIGFALANVAGAIAPFGPVAAVVNIAFTLTMFGIAWYLWTSISRRTAATA